MKLTIKVRPDEMRALLRGLTEDTNRGLRSLLDSALDRLASGPKLQQMFSAGMAAGASVGSSPASITLKPRPVSPSDKVQIGPFGPDPVPPLPPPLIIPKKKP